MDSLAKANTMYKYPMLLLTLFLIIGAAVLVSVPQGWADSVINCDIRQGPCVRQVFGGQVVFDVHPKPVKAMENLTFSVAVTGMDLDGPPSIDLGMPGMKMGPNFVAMTQVRVNYFEGPGVIVRCPSGKTVWQAVVNLPEKGSVKFIFDVIY